MLKEKLQQSNAGVFYHALKIIKQKKTKKNYAPTVLSILKSNISLEFIINEKDFSIKKYIANFNYSQYGYENIDDLEITASADIFNGKTTVVVIPKKVYISSEEFELPPYYSEHSKKIHLLIIDLFERFKIMTHTYLDVTSKHEDINLYATKNVQILEKLLSDVKVNIKMAITKNNHKLIQDLFAFATIIIHAIMYSQKMFGRFIAGHKFSKDELFGKIHKELGINKIIDIYTLKKEKPQSDISIVDMDRVSIQWNGQVNVLVTLFYDMMNYQIKDKTSLLECKKDDVRNLLNTCFHDKNGNPINKSTIDTCLNEYRVDKRAKENKRIILKCGDE